MEEYSRDIEELKEKFVEAEEKYTACEFESIKKIGKILYVISHLTSINYLLLHRMGHCLTFLLSNTNKRTFCSAFVLPFPM